ncbi:MAG: 16S rRNA (uracil(1498)-N(3))-methyltransferase [Rhodoferax sp.]|nr:16S rRNA (uracil(1498)-N(3))-methyltransferase [Rhodoferax sp.]
MPRFYCPVPLATGERLELPFGAARHVQVLRLQPGDAITLFNGEGGAFEATIEQMGRSEVRVRLGPHDPQEREAARAVHLALGIPANERMDWLVEKATELGVASIQPLTAGRSVLKLAGERADKRLARWRAIAVAACEQCGRNRVPLIHEVRDLAPWTQAAAADPSIAPGARYVLCLRPGARAWREAVAGAGPVTFLSGPEGGLTRPEEDAAIGRGFAAVTLGPRVLRAETAPIAVLAALLL